MKATGIVRRMDDLGRIVIPKEVRTMLHIAEGDPVEIFTENGGKIILQRYNPGINLMATLHSIDEIVCEDLDETKAQQVHELIKQISNVLCEGDKP